MTASRTADFVRRLTAPEPAVLAQLHRPDDITARILAATVEQAEHVGMRRITMEDTAWRFNRYAERARESDRLAVAPDAASST